MSFVDFFRPKWKHSDPDVRAEAVRDLELTNVRVNGELRRTMPLG